jgi:multidrug resistance efflux pump
MSSATDRPGLRIVSRIFRASLAAIVLLVALAITAVLIQTRPVPARRDTTERIITVGAMTVRPVRLSRVWEGYGTARAMDAADVSAQVTARIIERPPGIEAGAGVKKGDVILRLDPTDYRQRVLALEETIAGWEAQVEGLAVDERRLSDQLELAQEQAQIEQKELDRMIAATTGRAGSATEVERRRASLARARRELSTIQQQLESIPPRRSQLQAGIATEQANLTLARENLARTTIASPLDGILQSVAADEGELVMAGAAVARVVDLRRIEVPVRLPLAARESVAVGDRAELRTDASRADRSAGPALWTGRIVRIAPEADAATRTVTVFVEVEQETVDSGTAVPRSARGLLLPGQFVAARVITAAEADQLVVPRRIVTDGAVAPAARAPAKSMSPSLTTSRHASLSSKRPKPSGPSSPPASTKATSSSSPTSTSSATAWSSPSPPPANPIAPWATAKPSDPPPATRHSPLGTRHSASRVRPLIRTIRRGAASHHEPGGLRRRCRG